MDTKLKKLKDFWAAGDYRAALKLAASWPRLGDHKAAIERGWAACTHADLYRQMGKDPRVLYGEGLAAVADRYELPHAPECVCIACAAKFGEDVVWPPQGEMR